MTFWYSTNASYFAEASPEYVPESSKSKRKYSTTEGKATPLTSDKLLSQLNQKRIRKPTEKYSAHTNGHLSSEQSSSDDDISDNVLPRRKTQKASIAEKSFENENGRFQDATPSGKASQYTQISKQKVLFIICISLFFFLFLLVCIHALEIGLLLTCTA